VASPIPVLCGVGHETDVTLADSAADVRAPTPTAAAELASPTQEEGLVLLAAEASVMTRRMHHVIDTQAQALDHATLRLMRPADLVRRHAQRLALLGQRMSSYAQQSVPRQRQRCAENAARLQRAVVVTLATRQQRLASLEGRLAALDPRRVLARGYAWLSDEQGTPITSVKALTVGQPVQAEFADGQATATITRLGMTRTE